MPKLKRVTPFIRKAKGGKKRDDIADLDERVAELEMQQAGIDVNNLKNQMALMTAEQMANSQQIASQNALMFFNEALEQARKRLPAMDDERIVTTLLAIWDKIGGKK